MESKNHEEYLEELETKIAERMLELADTDMRARSVLGEVYRRQAKQDVEIEKLRESVRNHKQEVRALEKENARLKKQCEREELFSQVQRDSAEAMEELIEENDHLNAQLEYHRQGLVEV